MRNQNVGINHGAMEVISSRCLFPGLRMGEQITICLAWWLATIGGER